MSAARAVRAAGPARRVLPPQGLPRLIPPDGPLPLTDHIDRYGPVPLRATDLITEVEQAGLTGRGGASFPTGRKMRAVAEAGRKSGPLRGRGGTVVVANGAESEPASGKDRLLDRKSVV